MTDPFAIEGPALISFSGGRTSAYMLWRILEAHDHSLPEDVHVQFSNTGKERAETLRFVHEVQQRWQVKIHWLEWRPTPADIQGKPRFKKWINDTQTRRELITEAGYAEVGFNSASREGEPFTALIVMKQYAPNAVTRFCSSKLKVETAKAFALHALGFTRWANVVGLRHDEGHRILKALARNDQDDEPFKAVMPLGRAHITKRDVLDFWWGPGKTYDTRTLPQGFDLNLRSYEGNCDLCFLKSKEQKINIIRENPGVEVWWTEAEGFAKGQFVTEYSLAELAHAAQTQGFFDFDQPPPTTAQAAQANAQTRQNPAKTDENEEYDAECGLICG